MRMVVLNPDQRDFFPLRPFGGVLRGEIVRVQVTGQRFRSDIEQPLKMRDLSGISLEGLHVFEISDMLAWKNIVFAGETEAGLLLGSAGEDRLKCTLRAYRKRHIAPGAAGKVFPPVQRPAERIVAAGLDTAVMKQKPVGNAAQIFHRLVVIGHHGGIGEIRARHDEHIKIIPKEQYVQRRVREHHAHISVLADMPKPRLPLFEQDNGLPKAVQNCPFLFRDTADFFGAGDVPAHNGEWFFVSLLAAAEHLRNLRIVTAAGQMNAAETLDRDDFPRFQGFARKLNGVARYALSIRVQKKYFRPAVCAAVRLGVIAAVFNVMVFPIAIRAHGKSAHGGLGPVIGHIPDNRKARAAVGAVDEGIAISPIRGIEQFPQAVVTDGDIRRDQRIAQSFGLAAEDLKTRKAFTVIEPSDLDFLNYGELRRLFRQLRNKSLQRVPLPFQLQLHAGGGVFDRAAQIPLPHLPVDKGTKADALYDAANMYPCAV